MEVGADGLDLSWSSVGSSVGLDGVIALRWDGRLSYALSVALLSCWIGKCRIVIGVETGSNLRLARTVVCASMRKFGFLDLFVCCSVSR